MKRFGKAAAPESSRSQKLERLTDAVRDLADELRVGRDVLDEVRQELGWLTRNGIPRRHGAHTQLLPGAADLLAPDANEHLEIRSPTAAGSNSSELSAEVLNGLVSEIAEVVTVVGQEQLNLLLTALDDARTKLVAAIKASSATKSAGEESTDSSALQPPTSPVPAKPSETRSLF
jgi:hypothetical protein